TLFHSQAPETLGTLIIAGAVGNVRGNYGEYATYMASQGWDVVLFDYRGIGESTANKEEAAKYTMLDWAEKDLAGVINWARWWSRTKRLVLVGHSIGGQLAGMTPNCDKLTALVTVAAQRGYWRYWDGWRKWVICLFWHVYVPVCVKVFGRLPLKNMDLEDV